MKTVPPIAVEIEQLRNWILEMGGLVEAALYNGARSVCERNEFLAAETLALEPKINQFEMRIDEFATRLIALHQPVAGDLRCVTAALKINKDLERMGDLAVNIAEHALSFIWRGLNIGLGDIPEMSKAVQSMVRQSLDAFVRRDQKLARSVIDADDLVDSLKDLVYRDLIGGIQAGSIPPAAGFDVIFFAHNLERIADHASNISEDVLFMITGSDVRHPRST